MTSLGKHCATGQLEAEVIQVSFLSVADSNISSSLRFISNDQRRIEVETLSYKSDESDALVFKDTNNEIQIGLSTGGVTIPNLRDYQLQLKVDGQNVNTDVLTSFHLNLDDSPELDKSLVTASAISHFLENEFQPILLTAPAGSQGGVYELAPSH